MLESAFYVLHKLDNDLTKYIGITEANYLIYAAKHYDSVFMDTIEFQEDLKRFAYIKRLFNIYKQTGELKDRLIFNHLMVIYNCWGENATPMLFLKLKGYEHILKTFLVFMNRMPEVLKGIGLEQRSIYNKTITLDPYIWDVLQSNFKVVNNGG